MKSIRRKGHIFRAVDIDLSLLFVSRVNILDKRCRSPFLPGPQEEANDATPAERRTKVPRRVIHYSRIVDPSVRVRNEKYVGSWIHLPTHRQNCNQSTKENQQKGKKERKKEKEKSRRYDQSEWQIGFSNLFHSLVELYFR